jgi:transposase
MWDVGVDWAETHHDLLVLDEAGHRTGSRRVANSQEGLEELQHVLLSITPNPEELACIVETSHGLLIAFLQEKGFPVYPVNPKAANALRTAAGVGQDRPLRPGRFAPPDPGEFHRAGVENAHA